MTIFGGAINFEVSRDCCSWGYCCVMKQPTDLDEFYLEDRHMLHTKIGDVLILCDWWFMIGKQWLMMNDHWLRVMSLMSWFDIWCSQRHLLSTTEIEWLCRLYILPNRDGTNSPYNQHVLQCELFLSLKWMGSQIQVFQLHRSRWFCSSNPFFVWFTWLIHNLVDSLHSISGIPAWPNQQQWVGSGLRKREAVLEATIASLTSQLNSQSNCNLSRSKKKHSLKRTWPLEIGHPKRKQTYVYIYIFFFLFTYI